jgi:hypothetical protein
VRRWAEIGSALIVVGLALALVFVVYELVVK